jgi:hypothetical protein
MSRRSNDRESAPQRQKLPPEAMVEVLASAAEAAIKATNYLRRSVPDF